MALLGIHFQLLGIFTMPSSKKVNKAIQSIPALGGMIDVIDKRVSMLVYKISLGSKTLEFLLSIVGHQHGIPITAMAQHCVTLASVSDWISGGSSGTPFTPTVILSAILTVVQIMAWAHVCLSDTHEKFYQISKLKLASSILFCNGFVHYYSKGDGRHFASWYFCSYLLTQSVVMFLKVVCVRMRPAHALAKEVADIPRSLPRITFRNTGGWTVFESFPSGDAAGAMVFSVVLEQITGSNLSYLFALGGCFGRMYLFAHHFLDVTCGCLIAFIVTSALNEFVGVNNFAIAQVLVAIPAFIIFFSKVMKLRKIELPEEYKANNSALVWGTGGGNKKE